MAKLTLYGREMDVTCSMPLIYAHSLDDVEFLRYKVDQAYDRSNYPHVDAASYKTNGSIVIDLEGAFLNEIEPPICDPRVYMGRLRAKYTYPRLGLLADWGVEQ